MFVQRFGIALLAIGITWWCSSGAFAQASPAITNIIDTGEHYFSNQACLEQKNEEEGEEITPEACQCIISAKYVQVKDQPAISEMLKPMGELHKYCDYNYEHGADDARPNPWKEIGKEAIGSGAYQYSIIQEVSYNGAGLLNVVDYSYVYSGGAHGNTAMDSLLFDMKKNAQMDIATLLNPEKIPAANRAIQDQLDAKPAGEVFEEFRNLEAPSYIKEDSSCEACVYVLKDTGIYAVFQQYGVGPYSSGFMEFKLPDDVLVSDYGIVFKKE